MWECSGECSVCGGCERERCERERCECVWGFNLSIYSHSVCGVSKLSDYILHAPTYACSCSLTLPRARLWRRRSGARSPFPPARMPLPNRWESCRPLGRTTKTLTAPQPSRLRTLPPVRKPLPYRRELCWPLGRRPRLLLGPEYLRGPKPLHRRPSPLKAPAALGSEPLRWGELSW